ncbi:MAG: putative acyltransferase [Bacteroidota bacterium]|jgi:peptidoglycan/LPS O-acetylase OafA/YrhL|nr:putative acyltransferase [Bacteroidota bacterium]
MKINNHVPVLDVLRALAALSVCLYHFVIGPINFITNESVLNFFGYGKYGVQLFFVISGFIIPWALSKYEYNLNKYPKFLLKRFLRLEPPYLISIALALGVLFVRGFYSELPSSRVVHLDQFLLHIGYLIPFSNYKWILEIYWTLAIEFQFYLFMGLFYFAIINKRSGVRILSYIIVLFLSFIGTRNFVFYWLPVFLLGNILFLFMTSKINRSEFYFVSLIIQIFIGVFLSIPILVSSIIAYLTILFMFNYSNRVFAWVGKISYSIYLIHTIVGTTVINILSHHVHSPIMKMAVVLTGVAVTIFVSYMMYLLVEKPSQKLSSKIKL